MLILSVLYKKAKREGGAQNFAGFKSPSPFWNGTPLRRGWGEVFSAKPALVRTLKGKDQEHKIRKPHV